jgi:hypothetical protein
MAESVAPDGEKARSWKESSLSGRASLAAVDSQAALSSGRETLSCQMGMGEREGRGGGAVRRARRGEPWC